MAGTDFGLLKGWIKDFKKQQGRDPFFEDFPDDIGTVFQLSSSRTALLHLGTGPDASHGLQGWNGNAGKHTSKIFQKVSNPGIPFDFTFTMHILAAICVKTKLVALAAM